MTRPRVKARWGRGVEIRGIAEVLDVDKPPLAPEFFSNEVIRVHPRRVVSLNIDSPGTHAHDAR